MEFNVAPRVTHVVHIGPGGGSDVAAYAAAGLAPIILVEAESDAVEELRQLETQHPDVRVLQAAVGGSGGTGTYYRTNFSELNGLARPTGIRDLFPGLKILAEVPVETADPAELLRQMALPEARRGLLVLETPAQSLNILEKLAASGMLEQFSILRIQEGHVPLYDGSPGLAKLGERLEELGYAVWDEASPTDPDRPYLIAIRSGAGAGVQQELARHEAETERLGTALGQLEAEKSDLEQSAGTLKQKVAELEQERERLEEMVTGLRSEKAELASAVSDLEKSSEKTGKQIADLQARLESEGADAEQRMLLAREEMLKAEGQIRLLRDLLLGGSAA